MLFFSFLSHSTLCLSLACSIFFAFFFHFFWFRSKEEIKFIYYAIIIKPIMKAISSVVSASMYLWLWNVINKMGGAYNNLIPLKTYSVDQHIFNFIYFFFVPFSLYFILYYTDTTLWMFSFLECFSVEFQHSLRTVRRIFFSSLVAWIFYFPFFCSHFSSKVAPLSSLTVCESKGKEREEQKTDKRNRKSSN